jgi:CRP/FNR family transcriptional regulator, cyclic AMP receptor protein
VRSPTASIVPKHVHDLLKDCALLRKLSSADQDALVRQARLRKFDAGETIFLVGSHVNSMMAVLSGNVKISVSSPDGREVLLAILHPGEVFGEIALLDGKERSADARAMAACELAILDRRDVLSVLDSNPTCWKAFVEVLCARLRQTDQHLAEVALLPVPARLAMAVLRVNSEREIASRAQVRVSQRELAGLIGASRESVNKSLREWHRAGIVKVDDGFLVILDRTKLEAVAQQDF